MCTDRQIKAYWQHLWSMLIKHALIHLIARLHRIITDGRMDALTFAHVQMQPDAARSLLFRPELDGSIFVGVRL